MKGVNWKINYITTGYLIDEQDFDNFPEEKKILFPLSFYKNLSLFCGVMHVAAVSAQQELSLWHTS